MLAPMGMRWLLPFALLLPLRAATGSELPRFDLSKMDPVLGQWLERARSETEASLAGEGVPDATKAAAIGSLGQTYYAFDLLDPALTCFALARDLAPDEVKWQYLAGQVASTLGRFELARDALHRATEDEDAPLAALVELAELHLLDDQPQAALALFSRIGESAEGAAVGHYGAARSLMALGRHEDAIPRFRRALELQPQASAIHYPLARALLALGRQNEAERHLALRGDRNVGYPDPVGDEITDIKALVAFQVVHSMAEEERARPPEHTLRFALSYLGDLEGTVEAFESIMQRADLRSAPPRQRAILHYVTGGIALRQGLDRPAREHFEDAVELDPALIDARILLGNQLAREGDYPEAAEQFSRALEQRPEDAELLLKRATALLNAGRPEDAAADLTRIPEDDPHHLQAAIRLAQVDEVAGRPEGADARLQRLVDRTPTGKERLEIESAWAEIEGRRGALPDAIDHLRRGLEAAPADTATRLELARLLGGIGDLEAAESEFARVLTAWPEHPGAHQGRVTALILLERYGEAVALLEEALRWPEPPPASRLVLIRTLSAAPDREVRDPRRAVALARDLTESVGDDTPLVIDSLAMAEAAVGSFPRAEELQQRVVESDDSPAGAATRLELYRRGRPFVASRPEDLLPPTP